MKRISALVLVLITIFVMAAPAAFADEKAAADTSLSIVSTSPEDGDTNVAVDNFSVKIYFSKEMMPASEAVRASNEKQFSLKDEDGKKIPVKVYYSEKEKKRGLMMVAADYTNNNEKDVQIKGATKYILTIGKDLQATNGSTMGQTTKITLTTLNQQRSTYVYMILMFLMMGGMIFFTMRSAKKAQEKKKEEKTTKGANPYKEAKKTGKSIEEIVEKNKKAKAKKEEALAKQKAHEAELEAEILEKMRKEKNKRVSGPRPISAAGSGYKVEVQGPVKNKAEEPHKSSKGTTNPKNQSGKKKNTRKKKK